MFDPDGGFLVVDGGGRSGVVSSLRDFDWLGWGLVVVRKSDRVSPTITQVSSDSTASTKCSERAQPESRHG